MKFLSKYLDKNKKIFKVCVIFNKSLRGGACYNLSRIVLSLKYYILRSKNEKAFGGYA